MIVEYKLQVGTENETISFADDNENVIITISTAEFDLKACISKEDFFKIANTMQEEQALNFPADIPF